jgi:NAD+ kinase
LLVTHTGRKANTEHARRVAADLIDAGFTVRVVADEALDLDLPGVVPVTARRRARASRSCSRSAATARCCAPPSWPGRRVPLLGINLGKVGFLAEIELGDLDGGAATWSPVSTQWTSGSPWT